MTPAAPNPCAFLITIDTEGDNLWEFGSRIETRNARFLPRFQQLCENHGFKPVYLTNYEMAMDPYFVEFGRDVIRRGTGEIGMHLHAWNSPPDYLLTADDHHYHPYLIEYPDSAMADKIACMTELLEEKFGVKMTSHRAGRWAFDERYARLLAKHGYTVDCSVTPGLSWRRNPGDPLGNGGTDYTRFPDHAYWIDLDDISRPGNSKLLELPMTLSRSCLHRFAPWVYELVIVRSIAHRLVPSIQWLRPFGNNDAAMLKIVRNAAKRELPYLEFMLHSSELMSGGSSRFRSESDIDRLYEGMAHVFKEAAKHFRGMTLAEYHNLLKGAG
jgi:hypothetical protein